MRFKGPSSVFAAAVSVFLWLSSIAPAARAQVGSEEPNQAKPSVVAQTQPRSINVADASVPLLDYPLTLADLPAMQPRAELKDKLGHLTQFVQNTPVDGAASTELTEVYLGRTNSVVWIVIWRKSLDAIWRKLPDQLCPMTKLPVQCRRNSAMIDNPALGWAWQLPSEELQRQQGRCEE